MLKYCLNLTKIFNHCRLQSEKDFRFPFFIFNLKKEVNFILISFPNPNLPQVQQPMLFHLVVNLV